MVLSTYLPNNQPPTNAIAYHEYVPCYALRVDRHKETLAILNGNEITNNMQGVWTTYYQDGLDYLIRNHGFQEVDYVLWSKFGPRRLKYIVDDLSSADWIGDNYKLFREIVTAQSFYGVQERMNLMYELFIKDAHDSLDHDKEELNIYITNSTSIIEDKLTTY
jgi:hypothetical protein